MMQYRLTYNGLSGFDYTGFDTKEDALEWVKEQTRYGLIYPLELMKYDQLRDEYKVIGTFTKAN